jgi:hypothetical protein
VLPVSELRLRVPDRFSGPIGFANGGWLAGLLAHVSAIDPAQVTLRKPIPLETDLVLGDGVLRASPKATDQGGGEVIAEIGPGRFTRPTPEFIPRAEALAAEERSLVRSSPEYGHCLVCGVDRPDGYRLRPGSVTGRPHTVACLWRPAQMSPPLADADIIAASWAAMDCPGVWTIDAPADPMLLGRMTATVLRPPGLRDEVIAVGQWHARDGRKMLTSTALYAEDGDLLAHSEQVWISIS